MQRKKHSPGLNTHCIPFFGPIGKKPQRCRNKLENGVKIKYIKHQKHHIPYLHWLGTVNHVKMYIQCHHMLNMSDSNAILLPRAALYHDQLAAKKGSFNVLSNDICQH